MPSGFCTSRNFEVSGTTMFCSNPIKINSITLVNEITIGEETLTEKLNISAFQPVFQKYWLR